MERVQVAFCRVQNVPYAIGFSSLRGMNVIAILPNAQLWAITSVRAAPFRPPHARLDTVLESRLVQHLQLGEVAAGAFRLTDITAVAARQTAWCSIFLKPPLFRVRI